MFAELPVPIIGADFLCQFGLLVDVNHHKLKDATTSLAVQGIINRIPSIRPMFMKATSLSRYDTFLREYPDIALHEYFVNTQKTTSHRDCEIKHSTTHHIVTHGPPVAA